MRVLGIDPDLNGAMALVVTNDQERTRVIDLPTQVLTINRKTRVKFDEPRLYSMILGFGKVDLVLVEEPFISPFASKLAISTSYYNYGWFCGMLAASGRSFKSVKPKIWQRQVGIVDTKRASTKAKCYEIASRLYPWIEFTEGRKTYYGRADALMIATFGLQNNGIGILKS